MIGASGGPRFRVLLPIVIASLLGCSSAQAAIVTVGSPLTASFLPATVGEKGILGINSELGEPGAHVSSPVDGAVIGWKLLGQGGPFELRVVRPEAAGTFLAGASGAPETLGSYGVGSFATDLPIEAGELVGIQVAEGARIGNAMGDAPGSTAAVWVGSPESEAVAPEREAADWELSFSATVLPAPTVASVVPTSGPIAGGTSVTVTGTDFTDVEGVTFGAVPAASYSVTSEGQLTAVAPSGTSAGAVPVSVTTEAGSASSAQPFTYSPPAPPPSTGPPPAPAQPTPACVVPKLHGKKLKAARKIVAKADCKLGKVTKKGAAGKRAKVVKQKPKPGAIRAPRSKVNVVLAGR
jgi:IPT/TIG domain/PASTA domain